MYGEDEILTLATRFQLSEKEAIRAFVEYMFYKLKLYAKATVSDSTYSPSESE
jgi:hypothetical protein